MAEPGPQGGGEASSPEPVIGPPGLATMLTWSGHRLDDLDGDRVGRVDGIFVGAGDGEPRWLLARMGRFGHHTLVPSRDAVEGASRVWVPYTRDLIRRAPRIEPGTALTAAAELTLADHYEMPPPAAAGGDAVSARQASGP